MRLLEPLAVEEALERRVGRGDDRSIVDNNKVRMVSSIRVNRTSLLSMKKDSISFLPSLFCFHLSVNKILPR
jgi:hypothetical protein